MLVKATIHGTNYMFLKKQSFLKVNPESWSYSLGYYTVTLWNITGFRMSLDILVDDFKCNISFGYGYSSFEFVEDLTKCCLYNNNNNNNSHLIKIPVIHKVWVWALIKSIIS